METKKCLYVGICENEISFIINGWTNDEIYYQMIESIADDISVFCIEKNQKCKENFYILYENNFCNIENVIKNHFDIIEENYIGM